MLHIFLSPRLAYFSGKKCSLHSLSRGVIVHPELRALRAGLLALRPYWDRSEEWKKCLSGMIAQAWANGFLEPGCL